MTDEELKQLQATEEAIMGPAPYELWTCPHCVGQGVGPVGYDGDVDPCRKCKGTGSIRVELPRALPQIPTNHDYGY